MIDFAEDFAHKTLDTQILDVRLLDGEAEIFRSAFGRLHFGASGQAIVEVLADLDADKIGGQFLTGVHIPEQGMSLSARSLDGYDLAGRVRTANRSYFHANTQLVNWQILCDHVDFQRRLGSDCGNSIRGYVHGVSEISFWKRTRRTETGFSESSGTSLDWLELDMDGIKISFRSERNSISEIRVQASSDQFDVLAAAENFLHSISIRVGRSIRLLAFSRLFRDQHSYSIFPTRDPVAKGQLQMLVLTGIGKPDQEFLPLTFNRLTSMPLELRNTFMKHLIRFWESQSISFQSSCLNLVTSIEGVMELVLESPDVEDAKRRSFGELRSKNKAALKEVRTHLELSLAAINDSELSGMIARFRESIKHVRSMTPVDSLTVAAEIVSYPLIAGEAANWESLRNRVAHGVILEEDETLVHQYFDCVGILHRLALGFIGWHGGMKEYSFTRFKMQTSDAPAAPPNA